jgi:transposase
MTQTPVALPHPVAPDHDNTLVLAIELSNKSWVLAAQVPGLTRVKAKQTIEPTAEALLAALQGYRERAKGAGRHIDRVIAIYEAGCSVVHGSACGERDRPDVGQIAAARSFESSPCRLS